MNYWQTVHIALRALRVNALRSALTMLGIVIGVGAVITMIAVGSGGQAQVSERIRSLGANLLVVTPGALTEGRAVLGAGTRHTLTEDDAEAIAGEVSAVAVAAPAGVGTAQVVHGNRNWSTFVAGVVPDLIDSGDRRGYRPVPPWRVSKKIRDGHSESRHDALQRAAGFCVAAHEDAKVVTSVEHRP